MVERKFLEIDGSFGEGGGSILRLSGGFSVLFNRPIRIRNIRANRPNPGLQEQHLLGIKTLSELTDSTLSDCKIGTTELTMIPGNKVKNEIHVNVGTAAMIGLLLQPVQIACLGFNSPEKIEISLKGGGTFGEWAPSLNYLKEVTYPIFAKAGYKISVEIEKHGFYPKGGASTKCVIYPPKNKLKPINLTELGNIDLIRGEIIVTEHLRQGNVSERIKKSIIQEFKRNLDIEIDIRYIWVNSLSPGVGLSLWAQSDTGAIISSGTVLGEKRISSEKLGAIAANELVNYIRNGIPVDNYLSDQLIPLMAYIKEPSRIKVLEVTSHARTNLNLIKLFTKRNYAIIKEKNYFFIEYQ